MRSLALLLALLLVVGAVALLTALATGGEEPADAASAQRSALRWTGAELAEAPRRDGDAWEVDIRRADGSLVEVRLGPALELRELDEERGAGGVAADDEVTGALRERAIARARTVSGPGPVRSVERELDGTLEVDVVRADGSIAEVELDRGLRVTDVDREELGDE